MIVLAKKRWPVSFFLRVVIIFIVFSIIFIKLISVTKKEAKW